MGGVKVATFMRSWGHEAPVREGFAQQPN